MKKYSYLMLICLLAPHIIFSIPKREKEEDDQQLINHDATSQKETCRHKVIQRSLDKHFAEKKPRQKLVLENHSPHAIRFWYYTQGRAKFPFYTKRAAIEHVEIELPAAEKTTITILKGYECKWQVPKENSSGTEGPILLPLQKRFYRQMVLPQKKIVRGHLFFDGKKQLSILYEPYT